MYYIRQEFINNSNHSHWIKILKMKRVDFKSKKFRAREFLILVSIIVSYLLIFSIMKYRDNLIYQEIDYYYSKIEKDYVEKVYDFLSEQGKYHNERRSFSTSFQDKLENVSLSQFRELVMENQTPGWGRSELTYVKYWYIHIRREYPNTLTISYDDFLKRLQTWTEVKLKADESLKKEVESLTLFSDNGYITLLVMLIIIAYPIRFIIYLSWFNYNIYNSNEN
jgi:hypothetical protein